MKFNLTSLIILATCFVFLIPLTNVHAQSVEPAPKITDREIVESLAEIKAEFKVIYQRFEAIDQRFEAIDQRFEALNKSIDQRFNQVDKRFEALNKSIDQRFNQVDKRFESLERTMLSLFGSLIVLIVALFGYIAWDRQTTLHPLLHRVEAIEKDIAHVIDTDHPQGSSIARIIGALRDLAASDEKLAAILKTYSLM